MDSNLESFFYSSSLSGNVLTLFTTGSVSHSINLNSIAGSVNTGSLLLTASYSGQVITFTKADNSTFALNLGDVVVELESGSLLKSSSFANGTMSFTKGDGTSYSLNLNSISASSLATASYSNQIVTFTKGDGTTFNVDLNEFVTQTESGSLLVSGSYNSSTNVLSFTKGNGTTFDPIAGPHASKLYNMGSAGDLRVSLPVTYTDTQLQQLNYAVSNDVVTLAHADVAPVDVVRLSDRTWNTTSTLNSAVQINNNISGYNRPRTLLVRGARWNPRVISTASGYTGNALRSRIAREFNEQQPQPKKETTA